MPLSASGNMARMPSPDQLEHLAAMGVDAVDHDFGVVVEQGDQLGRAPRRRCG